ncbi:uncharacterized protein LOC120770718 [Bactrocera tryoni]|uniref:uncharacterized protein LOC120770718 n=1 Tax=Bactrocera tryoni TaxID=59916 RepID=UPI001A9728B5|nr:uncharacterized protein LOC120770718 [Bactrocera tryoni]
MQTPTQIASTPLNDGETTSQKRTPRRGRELAMRQVPEKLNSIPVSSTTATGTLPTGRLPTLTRNLHLTAGSSPKISITETITTRSAVTISTAPKRMTRATSVAEVVVIIQNTEIKHENVDDDFVGSN